MLSFHIETTATTATTKSITASNKFDYRNKRNESERLRTATLKAKVILLSGKIRQI